jgi:hypothetical protein
MLTQGKVEVLVNASKQEKHRCTIHAALPVFPTSSARPIPRRWRVCVQWHLPYPEFGWQNSIIHWLSLSAQFHCIRDRDWHMDIQIVRFYVFQCCISSCLLHALHPCHSTDIANPSRENRTSEFGHEMHQLIPTSVLLLYQIQDSSNVYRAMSMGNVLKSIQRSLLSRSKTMRRCTVRKSKIPRCLNLEL